jgi:hypothetical protein
VCPRLVIEAGRDSQVTVIERFVSETGGPALVLPAQAYQPHFNSHWMSFQNHFL